MIVTTELIMSWDPCYTASHVRELVGTGVTPTQIAEGPIPVKDRYWVLLRLLSPEDQRLLACAIAERALMTAVATYPRSWDAIRVSRLYAMGEVGVAELEEAADAASAEWASWAAWAARETSWAEWASWAAWAARETSWAARAVCATAASASAAALAERAASASAAALAERAAWEAAVKDALMLVEAGGET